MSNTSRPLMGNSVARQPDPIVSATSPREFSEQPANPEVNTGIPAQSSPQGSVHDWEKRYKDLQSFHTRTLNDMKTEIEGLKANVGVNAFQVPKTAEELNDFASKNPETYQFIQTIAHDIAQKQIDPLVNRLHGTEAALESTKNEKAKQDLQARHPDFVQVDSSPEFHAWLGQQTEQIQGWIFNNPDDASKISGVLDMFKYQTGWGGDNRNTSASNVNANLDASRAVDMGSPTTGEAPTGDPRRNNPQYIWRESEIGNMRPEEYASFEAEIDLALSERRVQIGQ